jgi:hypothetical protein
MCHIRRLPHVNILACTIVANVVARTHPYIYICMYKITIFVFYEKIFHPLLVTIVIGNLLFVTRLILSRDCHFNHK